jgi:hypothetical protein
MNFIVLACLIINWQLDTQNSTIEYDQKTIRFEQDLMAWRSCVSNYNETKPSNETICDACGKQFDQMFDYYWKIYKEPGIGIWVKWTFKKVESFQTSAWTLKRQWMIRWIFGILFGNVRTKRKIPNTTISRLLRSLLRSSSLLFVCSIREATFRLKTLNGISSDVRQILKFANNCLYFRFSHSSSERSAEPPFKFLNSWHKSLHTKLLITSRVNTKLHVFHCCSLE